MAQCRGAASLDIREKTLAEVLVPKSLVEGSTPDEVISASAEVDELRVQLEERELKLASFVEDAFGSTRSDFRPQGWAQL